MPQLLTFHSSGSSRWSAWRTWLIELLSLVVGDGFIFPFTTLFFFLILAGFGEDFLRVRKRIQVCFY